MYMLQGRPSPRRRNSRRQGMFIKVFLFRSFSSNLRVLLVLPLRTHLTSILSIPLCLPDTTVSLTKGPVLKALNSYLFGRTYLARAWLIEMGELPGSSLALEKPSGDSIIGTKSKSSSLGTTSSITVSLRSGIRSTSSLPGTASYIAVSSVSGIHEVTSSDSVLREAMPAVQRLEDDGFRPRRTGLETRT